MPTVGTATNWLTVPFPFGAAPRLHRAAVSRYPRSGAELLTIDETGHFPSDDFGGTILRQLDSAPERERDTWPREGGEF